MEQVHSRICEIGLFRDISSTILIDILGPMHLY